MKGKGREKAPQSHVSTLLSSQYFIFSVNGISQGWLFCN